MRDPSLPPELEFIIIDYLFANKLVLASCSLVCSRWLPHTRKHLFHDVTVKPAVNVNSNSLTDFFHILRGSGEAHPEWAIGPCISKLTLDGSLRWVPELGPTLTCTLSFLHGLLSQLPRLASLCTVSLLMPDDLAKNPGAEQAECLAFKLEELAVRFCTAPGHPDLHHLLAFICMFSSIDSLSVMRWGCFMDDSVSAFSSSALSPPIIRSLRVRWTSLRVPSALYTLLADSPSVANGDLTHTFLEYMSPRELLGFSDFASAAGSAFRDVELHANAQLFHPSELFDGVSLAGCNALRSLVLSIELVSDGHPSPGAFHAADTRGALDAYTHFFHEHRDALPLLRVVHFRMRPANRYMFDAFARIAHDTFLEWPETMMQTVSVDEAEQNREVWASLEDALRPFPTLGRVELVLYERGRERLTEETKVKLRGALEGRLPRLWWSGIAKLIFESFV